MMLKSSSHYYGFDLANDRKNFQLDDSETGSQTRRNEILVRMIQKELGHDLYDKLNTDSWQMNYNVK